MPKVTAESLANTESARFAMNTLQVKIDRLIDRPSERNSPYFSNAGIIIRVH